MTEKEFLHDKLEQAHINRLATICLQHRIPPKSVLSYAYGERCRRDTLPNTMFHITKTSSVASIKSSGLNPYYKKRTDNGVFLTTDWLRLLDTDTLHIEKGDDITVLLIDTSSLKQDLIYDKNYLDFDDAQNVGDVPLAFCYMGAIEPSLITELFSFIYE